MKKPHRKSPAPGINESSSLRTWIDLSLVAVYQDGVRQDMSNLMLIGDALHQHIEGLLADAREPHDLQDPAQLALFPLSVIK